MKLNTIDAKTARNNVKFFQKQQKIREEEARLEQVQKIFDNINVFSKEGYTFTTYAVDYFDHVLLDEAVNMLKQLGYSVKIGKDEQDSSYLIITW